MRVPAITFALVLLMASATSARGGVLAQANDFPGYPSYRLYCSHCHGLDARGADAFASAGTSARDLTGLAAVYGWPLPKRRLLDQIGSRHPALVTWNRDLSPCGESLLRSRPPSHAAGVFRRGTALEILYFLDAIQEPPRDRVERGAVARAAPLAWPAGDR